MNIKNSLLCLLSFVILASCAKSTEISTNEENKYYIESWINTYHKGVKPLEDYGIYLIENKEGPGKKYDGEQYLYIDYTIRNMDRSIIQTSNIKLSKQISDYSSMRYYGPTIWNIKDTVVVAGLSDILKYAKEGSEITALIPSWLNIGTKYNSKLEYYKHKSNANNILYTINIKGFTNNIEKWEQDSVAKYINKEQEFKFKKDSNDFYFSKIKSSPDANPISAGSKVYVKYIGRRLDNSVFDTNIADTAKMYSIFNPYNKYESMIIKWADTENALRILDNGVEKNQIDGLKKALWKLSKGERAIAVFTSKLGYEGQWQGKVIPPYCPLMFDIEIETRDVD